MKKWQRKMGVLVALLVLLTSVSALGEIVIKQEVFLDGTTYDPLVLKNGNLLLPCQTKKGADGTILKDGDYLAWMVCLRPDGTIAWDHHYGDLPGATVYCRFVELDDGNLLGWAHHSVNQADTVVWRPMLAPTGEEVARDMLTSSDWPIIFVTNGRYWEDTHVGDVRSYTYQLPSGEVLWSISTQETVKGARRLIALPNGLLLLGRSPEQDTVAGMAMVTYGGQLQWRTTVRAQGDSYLQGGVALQDGSVLAVGSVTTWKNDKVDSSAGLAVCVGPGGAIKWEKTYDIGRETLEGVVEVSGGYCAMYRSDGGKAFHFLLLNRAGDEIGRASYTMTDMDAFSIDLLQWNGEVWVLANGTRGDRDGTLLLQLDMASLVP